jgi:hypothetical protein
MGREKGFMAIGLCLSLVGTAVEALPVHADDNPIVVENGLPGTTDWQLGSMVADDRTGQIKGYASAASVMQNSPITLYVSVNPAQSYTLDVYRIGWYGGLGGRLALHAGPLSGATQAPCRPDANTGLIDCGWPAGYTANIDTSWTTGVYLVRLINSQGYENYITFVVRDGRAAALRYQQSVTTYQAYNNYPDDGASGKSLYEYNSYGASTMTGTQRAVKVSFDRPYSDDGSGLFLGWELDFVRWLEGSGYDVTYSTNIDTHVSGASLQADRGFLSVGHDEYWSWEMFDAAQAARDAGVSLGFFGANEVFWQVRFEPSARGVANRVMVCFKDAQLDPGQGRRTTVNFRDPIVNRPEQLLVGVQFTSQVNYGNNVDYVVTNSGHWAYAGTGFADGDTSPGLVGYEMDRYMPEYPLPVSTSRTMLSSSPFVNINGASDYANSSLYVSPSGAVVFAAGTISWSWGLDAYSGTPDPRIQQTTANVLDAFIKAVPVGGRRARTAAAGGYPGAYRMPRGVSGGARRRMAVASKIALARETATAISGVPAPAEGMSRPSSRMTSTGGRSVNRGTR